VLATSFTLHLPAWVAEEVLPASLPSLTDQMRLVLRLAARDVAEGTGGPFAAAVVERDSGAVVSIGVNSVVAQGCSLAHAEVLALGLAQARVGSYDLSAPGLPRMQLVSSSQMCAMCLGAVVWSGVTQVAFATTTQDVTSVGFDEGPTPTDYADSLRTRGISVVPGLLREEGLAVLAEYVDTGGQLYNAHH
jgi:tRNA(Arg) A34 adenosine deaminase TadA